MPYVSGVKCDFCDNSAMWGSNLSKKWVTKWAREKGWAIGKHITCPTCGVKRKLKEARQHE